MRDNEPVASVTHFIGFLLSIAGLVLLVVFAALYGNAGHVVGFSIFGSSLVLLYLSSSLYHFFSKTRPVKKVLQKLDRSMVYVLIAGTYTPITLVIPERAFGWSLFGIVWGLALFGVFLTIFKLSGKQWLGPLLYLVMGWLIVIAVPMLNNSIARVGMWWLFLGGALYTTGVIFFSLGRKLNSVRWYGWHEVFHILVMGGSFSHFWFMLKHVLYM